jgi:chromosome partitioning protein
MVQYKSKENQPKGRKEVNYMGKAVKRIAFVNSKGGCGKTTSIYSVAWELTKRISADEKILVIDADKQKNLTFCFFGREGETEFGVRPTHTLYDYLKGENEDVVGRTLWQKRGNAKPRYYNVDMMISDKRLAEEDKLSDVDFDSLKARFNKLVVDGGYRYVLVDMPPSNKALNRIIFGCMVEYAIIPFSSDLFCVDGYADIIDEIDACRDVNENIIVLGAFFSRFFEGCGVDEFVRSDMESSGIGNLFKSYIPLLTEIRETPMFHRPISYYKMVSRAKTAVEKLVDEMLDNLERK